MVWVYDDPPDDPYERKMFKILLKLLHDKEVAHRGARNLGLFKFMTDNKFESPSELRRNILLSKGKPLFKPADAKTVWTFFQQKGGAEEAGSAYDAIVDRWLKFWFALTPQMLQDPINMISPFMYPLKTLETIPVYGDVLALSVDVVAQMNKNAAKMAQQYTPLLMGFLPIPEASTIGIVIGYMISTIFIFFNMIIFTTRHHFGEAFKQSLALIPFVGMALENFADSGDGLLVRYGKARLKIIDQLNESGIFSWLGWLITWTTIDPLYKGDPEQDAEWFKGMATEQFSKAKTFGSELYTNIHENLNSPEKRSETILLLKQKAEELKQQAQQGIEKAKNSELAQTVKESTSKGLASLGQAVAPPPLTTSQKLSRGVGLTKPSKLEQARKKLSEGLQQGSKSVIGKQAGGKRLSKIKHHKSKWRTQKRSKI
jgi:hypothetical protein